jgi:hypothetical protein
MVTNNNKNKIKYHIYNLQSENRYESNYVWMLTSDGVPDDNNLLIVKYNQSKLASNQI